MGSVVLNSLCKGIETKDIALMMEAGTSETSANFYQTTLRNIPGDSHFNTRRRKILISLLIKRA
jgi:hypothetical protein